MLRSLTLAALLCARGFAQAPSPVKLPDAFSGEFNIHYDKHPETVLDVYQPKSKAKGKRPGVIVIHGGGWTGGTKEAVFSGFCLPYLEKGFVVANVEYRLAKAAKAPAAVEDSLNAAQWFFKNAGKYKVDKRRVIVTGGSAGGHLSLMVGLTPKTANLGKPAKVAAVVNFYGITDVGDQLQGVNMRSYAVQWIPEQPGRFDLAKRVSPMTYVRKNAPPILTLHGDSDKTVPYEHGTAITKALKDAGAEATLLTVPGGGHGFPPAKMSELYIQIFDFLERHGVIRK